ncbi:hypothetical protein TUM19329_30800 [Legionella antarctica]|uniref:Protein with a bacterial immunoglobulin-like domain protein n=1 Tax=Legionella antarctica TaxID=2708020 RepID=A0A6F8T8C6_9GAMM|nr:hypothetical protein [Legionella antarctica]BCA96719.1 hypothetical protein TUM19329_30800 [Legionella antarctica]
MLKNILVTTLSLISVITTQFSYASDDSCEIQVAVSSPPILPNNSVAFNVTNDEGLSKSVTLRGGNAPKMIEKLNCSPRPYTVSATQYFNAPIVKLTPPIGECTLKSGNIILNGSGNSVAVVFPNDFICTQ